MNSKLSARDTALARSLYCTIFRGFFSERTTVCADSERCWTNISVARVMRKAALLEHALTSGSRAIIFFTRETGIVVRLDVWMRIWMTYEEVELHRWARSAEG